MQIKAPFSMIHNKEIWYLYRYKIKPIFSNSSINNYFCPHVSTIAINENYRFNPTLIEVVKELGTKVNTFYSNLQVIEVPGDNPDDYVIDEHDGFETMHLKVPIY